MSDIVTPEGIADFKRRAADARREIGAAIRSVIARHTTESPRLGDEGATPAVIAGVCLEVGSMLRDATPPDFTEDEILEMAVLSMIRGTKEPRPN